MMRFLSLLSLCALAPVLVHSAALAPRSIAFRLVGRSNSIFTNTFSVLTHGGNNGNGATFESDYPVGIYVQSENGTLIVTATTDPRERSDETAYIALDGALNSQPNSEPSPPAADGTFSLLSDPDGACGATLAFSSEGRFYACGALHDVYHLSTAGDDCTPVDLCADHTLN